MYDGNRLIKLPARGEESRKYMIDGTWKTELEVYFMKNMYLLTIVMF